MLKKKISLAIDAPNGESVISEVTRGELPSYKLARSLIEFVTYR